MSICVQEYTKKINGVTVLNNISFEFKKGNIYGLIGKNGSGKTMLLRAIAGLILPTKGTIIVNGYTVGKDLDFPPNMGIIIEKPEFISYLTGFENLKLLAEINHNTSDDIIREYMTLFSLDASSKLTMKKYSLGMKQKIAIIQAIMENPDILILDEPFNALDETSVNILRNLLLEFKEKGKLIILTSHNHEDIKTVCDHTLNIVNGKIQN